MRRIVRDRVAEPIEQTKPQMEDFIAQRLQYPAAFPYALREEVAHVREVRKLRITPLFKADYPPVEIVVLLRASLVASTSKQDNDFGSRTFDLDVDSASIPASSRTFPQSGDSARLAVSRGGSPTATLGASPIIVNGCRLQLLLVEAAEELTYREGRE
jgi:hypothetical protein